MVKPKNRQTVFYFTKGLHRRTQIYNWTIDILQQINTYHKIKTLINNNFLREAFSVFEQSIQEIINNNIDNLGYIIQNNQEVYGIETINYDLFYNIFNISENMIEKEEKRQFKPIEKPKQIIKEKKIYGIERKTKKRKLANLEIDILKNGKEQIKLRDKKTGRYLGYTKKTKQRIKKYFK